jgi:hypothetical protein
MHKEQKMPSVLDIVCPLRRAVDEGDHTERS